jgi:hypothetical protein
MNLVCAPERKKQASWQATAKFKIQVVLIALFGRIPLILRTPSAAGSLHPANLLQRRSVRAEPAAGRFKPVALRCEGTAQSDASFVALAFALILNGLRTGLGTGSFSARATPAPPVCDSRELAGFASRTRRRHRLLLQIHQYAATGDRHAHRISRAGAVQRPGFIDGPGLST